MQEVAAKMLIKPKKLTVKQGYYKKQTVVETNSELNNFSYLFTLCGIGEIKRIKADTDAVFIAVGKYVKSDIIAPKFNSDEAYCIKIKEDGIIMSARSEKGLDRAVKCYIRLLGEFDNIPCMDIEDEPSSEFRGVHLCIFDPKDGTQKEDTSYDSIAKMLKTAAISGYNYAIIEFWGMFPYQRNTFACWSHSDYTLDKVKKLISYAIDDLHITPCPCQNMTSHAGWSRINSRRHVSLDQRRDLESMWVPGGWCFAVTNPKTQAFLKDCMEELIEAFRNPPFFHASCDKCFGFASTEEERTKPADALFTSHISNLNTFLQERGVRMVMWGDMIYSSADSLYWKPDKSIADLLPKNILINVWTHNPVGDHWYDVDFFESRGYQTVYSPFISREGITQMNNLCHKKRSYGILQTTWHKPQTAAPQVVYNAALTYGGSAADDKVVDNFINTWYR